MFVSEWYRVEAVYDAKIGVLFYLADSAFIRSLNRLIVTAKERDRRHYSMFSRLYFRPFFELAEERVRRKFAVACKKRAWCR